MVRKALTPLLKWSVGLLVLHFLNGPLQAQHLQSANSTQSQLLSNNDQLTESGRLADRRQFADGSSGSSDNDLRITATNTLELQISNEASLISVEDSYESYQWYRDEEMLSGEASNTLYVDNHGSYFVAVSDGSGDELYSDTLSIPEIIIEEVQTLGTSCGGGQGAIRVLPKEFFQEFEYALTDQPFQSDNHFYGLYEGEYQVKIRSKHVHAYNKEEQASIEVRSSLDSYDETFEDQPLLRLDNPDLSVGWRLTSSSFDGDGALFLNFFNYSSVGQEDYYILSNTFSSTERLNLTFAYAYAKYAGNLALNDSLAIVQSFDCGSTWQTLVQRGGDELSTSEPGEDFFRPDSQEDWAVRSVLIEPSEDEFLLAFKTINGYGNTLYLDSVTLAIHENQPPVFEPVTIETEENSFGEFTFQAFDFEGENIDFAILTDSVRSNPEVLFVGSTGRFLYTNMFLNYEEDSLVQFLVEAEDESGGRTTTAVTIEVIDVNDLPVSEDYPEYFVNERSAGGTEVGLLEVFDEDEDPIVFELEYSDAEDSLFVIDSATGIITVHPDSTLANAEDTEYYDLTVIFSDVSEIDFYAYPRVYLVELAPVVVSDTLSVLENEAIDTEVGQLDVTNLSEAEVSLSIVFGNNGDAFTIENSGLITVNNPSAIDFESIPLFVLGIRASNEFGGTTTLVVINVEDITDGASSDGCRLTKYSEQYEEGNTKNINMEFRYRGENLVTVIDETELLYASFEYNDAHQMTSGFISSFQEGPFNIVYDGDLLSEFVWDVSGNSGEYDVIKIVYFYEDDTVVRIDRRSYISPTEYYPDFVWTFDWRDGQIFQGTFKEIGDDEEHVVYQFDERDNPFYGLDAYFFINQFDPVHTISKSNLLAYSGDDTYVYDYEYDSDLPVSGIYVESNSLATVFTFDYEGCGVDNNNLPLISDQSFLIDENSPNETVLGTIQASDPDGDDLTFSLLSGNTDDAFALSTTGELTVQNSGALDFETTPTFNLEVEVNDGNGGTDTGMVTVNLNDVEESTNADPVIADQSFSIEENSAVNAVIGTIQASDPDEDELIFSILSGNVDDAFALSASGELTVETASVLDFEVNPTFNLEVEVNDGNGGTDTGMVVVSLIDIDEEQPLGTNSAKIEIEVYPNPSKGLVYAIVHENDIGEELVLVDFSGRILIRQKITALKMEVDLSPFGEGIYLLIVNNKTIKISKGD